MELNISLDSLNKVYYAGDYIQGSVLVINKSKTSLKFDLAIKVVGYYSFHNTKENPPKQKAVFFYNKVNTINTSTIQGIYNNEIMMLNFWKAGKIEINIALTVFRFSFLFVLNSFIIISPFLK